MITAPQQHYVQHAKGLFMCFVVVVVVVCVCIFCRGSVAVTAARYYAITLVVLCCSSTVDVSPNDQSDVER